MLKSNSKTSASIILITSLLLIAAFSVMWVSGQDGTIPDDLQPGEVIVITRSSSGGVYVGVTVKQGDNGLVERTVVLGNVVAQTFSKGGKILEGVDAYTNGGTGSPISLGPTTLSAWSQELRDAWLQSVDPDSGTFTASSEMIDVLCLTDDGRWTSETVRNVSVSVTPVKSIIDSTIVDFDVTVTFTSDQGGTCATFVARDNFADENIQDRADISFPTTPTEGGVSSDE